MIRPLLLLLPTLSLACGSPADPCPTDREIGDDDLPCDCAGTTVDALPGTTSPYMCDPDAGPFVDTSDTDDTDT